MVARGTLLMKAYAELLSRNRVWMFVFLAGRFFLESFTPILIFIIHMAGGCDRGRAQGQGKKFLSIPGKSFRFQFSRIMHFVKAIQFDAIRFYDECTKRISQNPRKMIVIKRGQFSKLHQKIKKTR